MAGKVTSMLVLSAVIARAEGRPVDVSGVCRDNGVSRQHFYDRLKRFRAEGLAGFEPRSRRPLSSPNQTAVEVEDRIVELRKRLADEGLDHGATTIQWHLGRDPTIVVVPSVATIHRILVRRGQVTPQPHKRPKGSFQRFEAPAPNEWWQIDSMDWTIAAGVAKVFNVIDDHSRVVVASRGVAEATSVEAWTTFVQAGQRFGLPAGVLSDNGLAFSGRLRKFEVFFERQLRDAGVRPITGRPFHPQTTGKVERFQQTLKKWLRKQRLAKDLDELQDQLDAFAVIYNHQRPHQGIGRQIPIERFHATRRAHPADRSLEHPTYTRTRTATVTDRGSIFIDHIIIAIGAHYIGNTATIVTHGTHASVFIDNDLVRHLTIDHTRRYQPLHSRPGRPPQLQS